MSRKWCPGSRQQARSPCLVYPGKAAAATGPAGACGANFRRRRGCSVDREPGRNAVGCIPGGGGAARNSRDAVHILTTCRSASRVAMEKRPAEKANKLMQKLGVCDGIGHLAGWVGVGPTLRPSSSAPAVPFLTLAATLFASWAWGFTLNRVSLVCADLLDRHIWSDDAIVVVENIHRHQQLDTRRSPLQEHHSRCAVDEVGGPTILGHPDGDRRAAADGVCVGADGPLHEPDPRSIPAWAWRYRWSIAFTGDALVGAQVHARRRPGRARTHHRRDRRPNGNRVARHCSRALLAAVSGNSARKRWLLLGRHSGRALLLSVGSGAGAAGGAEDAALRRYKSEFQVVVEMPAGTPLEDTAATLQELGAYFAPASPR